MVLRSFVASKKLMIKKELAEYYLFQKKGGGTPIGECAGGAPSAGAVKKHCKYTIDG